MSDPVYFAMLSFQFYVWDFYYLTSPWFIIILSETLRTEVLKMFGWKKENQVDRVTVVSTASAFVYNKNPRPASTLSAPRY